MPGREKQIERMTGYEDSSFARLAAVRALDEQDFVVDRLWFGADAVQMAMHQGDPFEQVVLDAGATGFPVGTFMPAQRYLLLASGRPPNRKTVSLSLHVSDGHACD